jgi:tetratricopeptide (TPR) repeat protein
VSPREAPRSPAETAVAQAEAGDVEGALVALRKRVDEEADDVSARLALGSVLSAARRWDEAAAALREAVELDGDVPVARVLYARALEGAGKVDDAVFQLLRAAKQKPDDPALLRELGGAFYRKGLHDKALQWLLKARAAASGDPLEEARALYAVGLAQEARRDPGAAISAYQAAIARDPGHLDARKTLADALASIGEHERAVAVLGELLDVEPTNEKAAQNREVLERALGEMQARRLVGKTAKELEASALVQAGQMKRKGKVLFGLGPGSALGGLLRRGEGTDKDDLLVRYASALSEVYASFSEDRTIDSLLFVLSDPDTANRKRDAFFQVTVVARDGRREPASYATAATLTFLREAMGMPMTRAAELYAELLAGAPSIEHGGLEAKFATTEGPSGTLNGLLVTRKT